jgi:hypothetical protein
LTTSPGRRYIEVIRHELRPLGDEIGLFEIATVDDPEYCVVTIGSHRVGIRVAVDLLDEDRLDIWVVELVDGLLPLPRRRWAPLSVVLEAHHAEPLPQRWPPIEGIKGVAVEVRDACSLVLANRGILDGNEAGWDRIRTCMRGQPASDWSDWWSPGERWNAWFVDLVRREFAFLVDEFGYRLGDVEDDQFFCIVRYVSQAMGVTVHYEVRDRSAFVALVPLIEGGRPSSRLPFGLGLDELLRAAGEPESGLGRNVGYDNRTAAATALSDAAALLRAHGSWMRAEPSIDPLLVAALTARYEPTDLGWWRP